MKTLIITLTGIILIAATACNQKNDPGKDLDNATYRNEVFQTIINDHQMMTEFMEELQHNGHGMMMMQENEQMMPGVMNRESMMEMMPVYMNDSIACEYLTDSIMVHRKTMEMMLNKMHAAGIMDQQSMEKAKRKVKESTVPQFDFGKVRHWH